MKCRSDYTMKDTIKKRFKREWKPRSDRRLTVNILTTVDADRIVINVVSSLLVVVVSS